MSNQLEKIAAEIRKDIVRVLVPQESHHIGCSLSIVDTLTVLYFKVLNVSPDNPKDPNRDIFILSKGHAGVALYATLAKKGFFGYDLLTTYDRDGGLLPEHATSTVPGVELSTGSLGHGLPVGIGFALSFRAENKQNKVYVLLSDGELDEGSNWEAILFAGHHRLSNLTVIVDYNKFQGYGRTAEVLDLEPLRDKFAAFRWNTYETDEHNPRELIKVFNKIKKTANNKPLAIIAHTVKGKGVPFFEGKFESHYHSITEETKQEILRTLNSKHQAPNSKQCPNPKHQIPNC